jgi:hypothetical protein
MTDTFLELCAREFAAHVKLMFDAAPRIPGTGMAEVPVLGGPFLLGMEVPDCLYQRVCMALGARERFHRDAPGWPTLPLHETDIDDLKNDDSPRLNLLGYYAYSLSPDWNYDEHPRFCAFASGPMFYEHTPAEIRSDLGLRREFPPRELAGLCDGTLYWRSPEQLAFDRDMLAKIAAYQGRMGA